MLFFWDSRGQLRMSLQGKAPQVRNGKVSLDSSGQLTEAQTTLNRSGKLCSNGVREALFRQLYLPTTQESPAGQSPDRSEMQKLPRVAQNSSSKPGKVTIGQESFAQIASGKLCSDGPCSDSSTYRQLRKALQGKAHTGQKCKNILRQLTEAWTTPNRSGKLYSNSVRKTLFRQPCLPNAKSSGLWARTDRHGSILTQRSAAQVRTPQYRPIQVNAVQDSSGSAKHGLLEFQKALKGPKSPPEPFRAFQNLLEPFRAFQSLLEPFRAFQSLLEPFRFQSEPFGVFQSLLEPFRAFQILERAFQSLFRAFQSLFGAFQSLLEPQHSSGQLNIAQYSSGQPMELIQLRFNIKSYNSNVLTLF